MMKKINSVKILLAISGTIGIVVGGALLFSPVAFEASVGIVLGENISLLSETRAAGGTIFLTGIIVLLGAFLSKLTNISLLLSAMLYLSYGFSRVFSMVLDGLPHDILVLATIAEVIIGIVSFISLKKTVRIVD